MEAWPPEYSSIAKASMQAQGISVYYPCADVNQCPANLPGIPWRSPHHLLFTWTIQPSLPPVPQHWITAQVQISQGFRGKFGQWAVNVLSSTDITNTEFWRWFGLILHAIIILWLFAIGFLNSRNNIPETLRWAENHCCHPALSHHSVRETKPTFVLGTLAGHWQCCQKKLGLFPCTEGHTTQILNS